MLFKSRYMLLRLLVKRNVFLGSDLMYSFAPRSVYCSAWRIFRYTGDLASMLVCEGLLNTQLLLRSA